MHQLLQHEIPGTPQTAESEISCLKSAKPTDLHGSVIYDEEFGLPNVALFIPPSQLKSWLRRDDTIDYVTETLDHQQETRVKDLWERFPGGIYPYDSYVRRFRNPEEGTWEEDQKVAFRKSDEHGPQVMSVSDFNCQRRFNTSSLVLKHLNADWRCYVSGEMLIFLSYLEHIKVITTVESIRDRMRPTFYVWWS